MKNKQYDWVIIGGGLYGTTFARTLVEFDREVRVQIFEEQPFLGGHAASRKDDGIEVHLYGPHIFHTNNEAIWGWANRFAHFTNFQFKAKAYNRGKNWSFPINLATGREVFGSETPEDFWLAVEAEASLQRVENPRNLEEFALGTMGQTLYDLFFYGYTKKAWGKDPKDLPASIIRRIPLRWTDDDRYFKNDRFEGIPENGYTDWIENIADHPRIDVQTAVQISPDYALEKESQRFVWTGPIDGLFNSRLGRLPYRSRWFEHQKNSSGFIQATPCVNICDPSDPRLRVIEHKHFGLHEYESAQDMMLAPTIYSVEYGTDSGAPYYPIRIDDNLKLYQDYLELSKREAPHIHLGGRLGTYRYMNMDQVIASAQHDAKKLGKEK